MVNEPTNYNTGFGIYSRLFTLQIVILHSLSSSHLHIIMINDQPPASSSSAAPVLPTPPETGKSSTTPVVLSPSHAVHAISLKLPPYLPNDPIVWFAQVEAQFLTRNITSQSTQFAYVIASLPPEIAQEIRDILILPPTENPYDVLKATLIGRTSASEQTTSINCSSLRSSGIGSLLNSCIKCANCLVIMSSRTVFYVNYFCNVYLKISSLYLLPPQTLCHLKSCPYSLTEYWKLLSLHRLLLLFPITCHRQQCQSITSKFPIYKAKSTSYLPNLRPSLLNLIHVIHLTSVVTVHLTPIFLGHHSPVHPANSSVTILLVSKTFWCCCHYMHSSLHVSLFIPSSSLSTGTIPQVRKLCRRPLVATSPAGSSIINRLFYVTDHTTGTHFLVDTSADVSVIPPSATENCKPASMILQAVNKSAISSLYWTPL